MTRSFAMKAIPLFTACTRITNWFYRHFVFSMAVIFIRVNLCSQFITNWFHRHFVFSMAVIFIWGLILSQSLAQYAVMSVLINYLGDKWDHLSLRKAAMVVNLVEGGSSVFVIIVAHISEAYTGRFTMISICTGAYVMGLILLRVVEEESLSKFYLFYPALVLTALGKAGKDPPLRCFLEFQLIEKMKQCTGALNEETEHRIDISTMVCWKTAWISGAAVAAFGLGNMDWPYVFLVCGSVMGVCYIFFLFGFRYYHYEKPTGSPLASIYRVFKAAVLKLKFEYPDSSDKYYWKDQRPNYLNYLYSQKPGELKLLPHVPLFFRFLDKAAIIREASNLSPERQERKGQLCAVKEVQEVKRLIPVIFLGLTFLAYSLVVASGDTYFVEQVSNLNPQIGSFKVSISLLFFLKSFARDVVVFSFWRFGLTQQRITIWRIGMGMFCAVLCCITAWRVELLRLSLIKREGVLQDPNKDLHLSILVLIPQYILWGLMEGFAESGLEKFFYNHVAVSMKNFEEPFNEMVLGIGKFLSIPCVLIFGSWFKETINNSHLDRYFLMIAILSFVFFCIYLCYPSGYNLLEAYPVSEEPDPIEEGVNTLQGVGEGIDALQGIEEGIDTLRGVEDKDNHAFRVT